LESHTRKLQFRNAISRGAYEAVRLFILFIELTSRIRPRGENNEAQINTKIDLGFFVIYRMFTEWISNYKHTVIIIKQWWRRRESNAPEAHKPAAFKLFELFA
jgi:hypothetical protein